MSPPRSVVTGIVASLCLLLAGCGSRVDGAEIIAQAGGGTVSLSADSLAALKAATRPAAAPAGVAESGSGPTSPTAATVAATTVARTAGKQPAVAAAAPPHGTRQTVVAPTGAESGRCEKRLETINVGHVGLFSGVAAPVTGNTVTMMAAWAKDVNARGGLACHPVRVFTKDDGGDASRAAALAKELAQRQKVVAFVAPLILAPAGFVKALGEVKVPAIGGGGGADAWFDNPWIFADGASTPDQVIGLIKHGVERGKTKLGILYCVEAAACTQNLKRVREGAAEAAGAELVYDAPISVTQPDYTAQCLNARDAGVDQFAFWMDGASMGRAARSCATVGFKPLISTAAGLISPAQSRDPTLRSFGVVTAAANAPWTEKDTPGLRSYHQALARWAPQVEPDGATLLTWSAAKLFEAAVAHVDAQALSGTVTPALVLTGLGKIKNNTLGGLTGPVTFSPGQERSTSNGCVFYQYLGPEGWTAPRGSKPVCLKP